MKTAVGAAFAAAIVCFVAAVSSSAPLWPGARFSVADRDRSQRHGLFFLYTVARQPDTLRDWGHDLLSAFVNISETNANREISDLAGRMGHERALAWRGLHPQVPGNANADDIANLVYGSDAADQLGVPDARFHDALRRAASRFSARDYLGFDPTREPPPVKDRYDAFQDALIAAYTFDHSAIPIGAHYRDVLRWLPAMHPYPARTAGDVPYYQATYTATHVAYTFNGYNQAQIAPGCFPDEFSYLNRNLNAAIDDRDPETLGEYLDTLQAFGLTWADSRIRRAVESLLAAQNPDGSWGDPHETDAYARYHTTWTVLDGIQSFRWRRVLPCPDVGRK